MNLDFYVPLYTTGLGVSQKNAPRPHLWPYVCLLATEHSPECVTVLLAPCSTPHGPWLLTSHFETSLRSSFRPAPDPPQPTTRNPPPTSRPKRPNKKRDIFHLEYHPSGIQRSQVHQVYSDTWVPLLPDQNLILAVFRRRNLQDGVCSIRLPEVPGKNPLDLMQNTIGGEGTSSLQILPTG
jgi:hypothetical protein